MASPMGDFKLKEKPDIIQKLWQISSLIGRSWKVQGAYEWKKWGCGQVFDSQNKKVCLGYAGFRRSRNGLKL